MSYRGEISTLKFKILTLYFLKSHPEIMLWGSTLNNTFFLVNT